MVTEKLCIIVFFEVQACSLVFVLDRNCISWAG